MKGTIYLKPGQCLEIALSVQPKVQNPNISNSLSLNDKENQQVLISEKVDPENVWHFGLLYTAQKNRIHLNHTSDFDKRNI